MTKISKRHPFVIKALEAERLEKEAGKVTNEVLVIRQYLKASYPELFATYLDAKNKKQNKIIFLKRIEKDRRKTKAKKRKIKMLSMRKYGRGVGSDIR